MKNNILRIALTVLLLQFVLTGCSGSIDVFSQSVPASLPVRIAHADLASGAASVEELTTMSEVAILATAKTAKQELNKADPTIVATIQSFTIDEVVWGKTTSGGIDVKFTGGVVSDEEGSFLHSPWNLSRRNIHDIWRTPRAIPSC